MRKLEHERLVSQPDRTMPPQRRPVRQFFGRVAPLWEKLDKPTISDTLAGITGCTAAGAFGELLIADLTLQQTLHARINSIWVNLITSRTYGVYRDWAYKKSKTTSESNRIRKFVVDTLAFLSFQLPLYAGILYFSGAGLKEAATACGAAVLISAGTGRIMGWWYDFVRTRVFGVSPAGTENQKKSGMPPVQAEDADSFHE